MTGAGGNVLVRATPDGQVLVDSGAAELAAEALVPAVAELAGGAPRPHAVQHALAPRADRRQRGVRRGRRERSSRTRKRGCASPTPYYLPAEDRYQQPLPAEAQPTESFYTTGETTIGGERIEYGYLLEAHTDGDIYVLFPRRERARRRRRRVAAARSRARLVRRRLARRPRRLAALLLELSERANAIRAELRRRRRPRRSAGRARLRASALRPLRRARAQGRDRAKTCSRRASWTAWAARGTIPLKFCTTRTRACGRTTTRCRPTSSDEIT